MRYGTAAALVVLASVLWSLQGLVFRQIEAAEPWAILFWRSLGMLPVLAGFIAWQGRGRLCAGLLRAGPAAVIGAIGLVFAFGGAVYAIQSTTVANAVFLFAASPFLTALLGRAVLGERVRRRTWASIAVAVTGIAVMVGGGLERGALAGNLAALASAAGFAVFTVSLRRAGLRDPLPTVFLGGAFAMTTAATLAGAAGQALAVPMADALWSLVMGVVMLSGGMVLYTLGSRVLAAADLALITMIEVMLAPVWVWLLLGETASRATLLGGVFILAAVLLNAGAGARQPVPS
ncbi:EamA family transporter [Rhodobacterales bacterium HKCCSP123]|nr:EamA family transporter [Rhodobacterales bacterium HKCCSP123]